MGDKINRTNTYFGQALENSLRKSGALGENVQLKKFIFPKDLANFYKNSLNNSVPKHINEALKPYNKYRKRLYPHGGINTVSAAEEAQEDLKAIVTYITKISDNANKFAMKQFELSGGNIKIVNIGLSFPEKEVNDCIDSISEIMLLALGKALEQVGRDKKGICNVINYLKELDSKIDNLKTELLKLDKQDVSDFVLAHKDIYTGAKVASMIAGAVESLIGSLAHATPRDLSITVDILGEGGGTQLLGNPVHWSIKVIMKVLNFAKKACDGYVALYKDYEIKAWRADVTLRLKTLCPDDQLPKSN